MRGLRLTTEEEDDAKGREQLRQDAHIHTEDVLVEEGEVVESRELARDAAVEEDGAHEPARADAYTRLPVRHRIEQVRVERRCENDGGRHKVGNDPFEYRPLHVDCIGECGEGYVALAR